MGCGLSLVTPNNSGNSYRKVTKFRRKPHDQKSPNKEAPFSTANTMHGKERKQAKQSAESERKDAEKEFTKETLDAHNEYRSLHGVPNLKLSKSLSAHAQKWADVLALKDMMMHSDCVLPNGEHVGENIYMCWSSGINQKPPGRNAVRSWYNEQSIYDYKTASFSYKTGHFTQVIWRDTKSVGLAWATSSQGSVYVVANYSPAGNVHGSFVHNVPPPVSSDNNNPNNNNNDNTNKDNIEGNNICNSDSD